MGADVDRVEVIAHTPCKTPGAPPGIAARRGEAPFPSVVSFILFVSFTLLEHVAGAQGRNEHAIDVEAETFAVGLAFAYPFRWQGYCM